MLALLASLLVVLYLLVPGAVFHTILDYTLPLRQFPGGRTEEVRRSILISVLPFLVAAVLSPFLFFSNSAAAYRLVIDVLAGWVDSSEFARNHGRFYSALTGIILKHAFVLLVVYSVTILEAILLIALATREKGASSGDESVDGVLSWVERKLLLRQVSEWYVLFDRARPRDYRTVVDVLCTDNVLYTGTVGEYFLDSGGKLQGFYLTDPSRFNRPDYLKDKQSGKADLKTADYWRNIPGKNLHILADKIINVNIRYESIFSGASSNELAGELSEIASAEGETEFTFETRPGEEQASHGSGGPEQEDPTG